MLGWIYLFFVFLNVGGIRLWGGYGRGVAACCWCGGLLISALGVYTHQIWIVAGSGYPAASAWAWAISPVST